MSPVDAAIERYRDGASLIEAAATVGRSAPWLYQKIRARGECCRPRGRPEGATAKTLKRAQAMALLYSQGRTLQEIGDWFSCTREYVRQVLAKHTTVTAKTGGRARRSAIQQERRQALRDGRCIAQHGCTWATMQEFRALGNKLMTEGVSRDRTPLGAFTRQKASARRRGIVWKLTFWHWWTIWQESGRWSERGRGQGYVMCRRDDEGAYEASNVYIATAIENNSNVKHKKSGLPTGVHEKNGKFYARRCLNGKTRCLGTFADPGSAYAAYLAAGEKAA